MGNLLFSPKGRIHQSAFIKGMIILGVFFGLINLIPMMNPVLGSFALLIAFILLIYPTIALFIKRCHESGKSGWLSIVLLILLVIIYIIFASIIGQFIGKEEGEAFKAAVEAVKGSTDPAEIFGTMNEYGKPYYAKIGIPSALISFLTFPVTALVTNLIFKRDDHENQYGPAS